MGTIRIGDIDIGRVRSLYAPPEWERAGHLHNNILTVLVTIGSVGFLAFAALFVKIWLEISRIEKKLHVQWFHGSLALDAEIIMVVWELSVWD